MAVRKRRYPKNKDDKELNRLRSNIAVRLCQLNYAKRRTAESVFLINGVSPATRQLMLAQSELYVYCLEDERYRDEFIAMT